MPLEWLLTRLVPALQVYEAYGQTECTAGCTYTTPGDWTPGERRRGWGGRGGAAPVWSTWVSQRQAEARADEPAAEVEFQTTPTVCREGG